MGGGDTVRYYAVSGGADSTAMVLLAHERGDDFEMVFADTGAELPETYWLIPRLVRYVDKPITVVSGGTFYACLVNRGFLLPGWQVRWCTRQLKQEPQDKYFGKVAETTGEFVVGVGIRADEAKRARLKPRWKSGHTFDYPLLDAGMDKSDVLTLCRKHNLLSPAYDWRTNTSCFCCPFQRVRDWRGLMKHHPDLYALAEDWEAQSGIWGRAKGYGDDYQYTWHASRNLKNLREASERQLALWDDDDTEEACTICRW